jgi:GNAT superfamily N-acetyltransferase
LQIREAASPAEVEAAAPVTLAAYAEFFPAQRSQAWVDYERELLDTATRAREGTLLIALDEHGEIVGTATLYLRPTPGSDHRRPGDAVLRFLGVVPAARGGGVATALLDECVCRARAAGCTRLSLFTIEAMRAAQALYERAGFVREPAADWPMDVLLLAYALEL